MSLFFKEMDQAFQGAGAKVGLEIWCIENLRLVRVPKSSHGKFYSGSAYIVLNTVLPKSGSPQHEIHYWLGNLVDKVDSRLASDKALELDASLGSCAVQYRELEGQETEKFLSYFKPCIIPAEGVYSSEHGHVRGETYQIRLLRCKGDRVVHVNEVLFSRSSLNHNDVFILDTASKVFLFSGCNSSIQERAKALEVVQYIKENKHDGSCDVAAVEDGKFVGDPDVGEFWSFFGGYAPIPRDLPSDQKQPDPSFVKFFWINTQGKLCQRESSNLSRNMLEADKCYLLDCNSEIYVWMGRCTMVTERKTSIAAAEDFLRNQGRSHETHLTFLTEGLENAAFRIYFDNWSHAVEPKLYEEGRGKVAAIFKHQGYDVEELPLEDCQPYISIGGHLKVWRVDGDELHLLPVLERKKLFSGDCYILQYTYPGSGRDENLFYSWLGRTSVMEDRTAAVFHMNTIMDSAKGTSVFAQVIEGMEPVQFFLIMEILIIFKGGKSKLYKKHLDEQGIVDDRYDDEKIALFRVQGTSPSNMQAIQVDLVASSLNSSYCYVLQSKSSVFTWIGSLTLTRDHDILDRMLDSINPTWQPISVREGSEPDNFWNAIGEKTEYPREKEIKGYIEDPHLFVLNLTEGDFKVKEIYNFTQDDLTTEDVLVLDCHSEIYIWVGCHSKIGANQQALALGQKFLETDVLVEGISMETPIYVITEGNEPPFFTRFFEWDYSKANMHGNSFDRKLASLKGNSQKLEVPIRNSMKGFSRESTPDGSRSLSPSVISSVSNFNSPYIFSSPSPTVRRLLYSQPSPNGTAGSPAVESPPSYSENSGGSLEVDESPDVENSVTYSYERLTVISDDPVKDDIDVTKREAYLSEDEFRERFGMNKAAFYKLPKWKQNKLKMSLHLF